MFDDPKPDDALTMKIRDFDRLIGQLRRCRQLLERTLEELTGSVMLGDEKFTGLYDAINDELLEQGREP